MLTKVRIPRGIRIASIEATITVTTIRIPRGIKVSLTRATSVSEAAIIAAGEGPTTPARGMAIAGSHHSLDKVINSKSWIDEAQLGREEKGFQINIRHWGFMSLGSNNGVFELASNIRHDHRNKISISDWRTSKHQTVSKRVDIVGNGRITTLSLEESGTKLNDATLIVGSIAVLQSSPYITSRLVASSGKKSLEAKGPFDPRKDQLIFLNPILIIRIDSGGKFSNIIVEKRRRTF